MTDTQQAGERDIWKAACSYANERFSAEFGDGATMRVGGARHNWWFNERDRYLRQQGREDLIP